jgi:GMP synthase (glutamine-hydrolysing)
MEITTAAGHCCAQTGKWSHGKDRTLRKAACHEVPDKDPAGIRCCRKIFRNLLTDYSHNPDRTMMKEIKASELNTEQFINEKVKLIKSTVGDGIAINALSGGVDSSTVTMLGYRALGEKLKTCFIDNGIMRESEPEKVAALFRKLGVRVEIIDAREEFLAALKGITDPEEKREAITQTFYKSVFGRIVRESRARYLLQGTILTDVDETVAGIKRQHNVFEQLGIDPQETFGYRIIEPLIELRKDGVRKVGIALGLPAGLFDRIPFPGPALAARIIGEVTPERLKTVRKATTIVEEMLGDTGAFQYMAILHEDRVTGMVGGKREFGQQIEIRCWDSVDARTATPTHLTFKILANLASEIIRVVPGVVSVTYNIAPKPPSTIEAV